MQNGWRPGGEPSFSGHALGYIECRRQPKSTSLRGRRCSVLHCDRVSKTSRQRSHGRYLHTHTLLSNFALCRRVETVACPREAPRKVQREKGLAAESLQLRRSSPRLIHHQWLGGEDPHVLSASTIQRHK